MAHIHQSTIINEGAIIGKNVEIGPFCIIGSNVKIDDNTKLKSHIIIEGSTVIGKNNIIHPFVTIGVDPQDLKFSGEDSKVEIGDNNIIREHVTIHKGTNSGIMKTIIGNNCLLMVGSHIAHDCILGNNIILANNATLAGHVEVEDNVIIGGLSAVHQFVKIGHGAMIGGMSAVENNVIPYGMAMGERAFLSGLNLVGLKRSKIDRDQINNLRHFFKEISENESQNISDKIIKIKKQYDCNLVRNVINFINSNSSRSLLKFKKR